MRTLVVGGGIAGQAVLEAIREQDPDHELTLVSAEPRLPVRPRRALHAAGQRRRPGHAHAAARVLVRGPADRRASRRRGSRRSIRTPTTAWSCAPGSDALVPPIPGAEHAQVFRGPEDCAAIAAHAGRRAVVIGGGLLGLEAAYGLASLGCDVTVVHLMDRLMERQLDGGAAALLAPAMEALGVEVLLERNTEEITAGGVQLAGGEFVEADLVVISVGIRPQVALARALGLEVNRGIVVDDHLATSHPKVFAVGECAEHRGIVHGIVAPIHEQARRAGRGRGLHGHDPDGQAEGDGRGPRLRRQPRRRPRGRGQRRAQLPQARGRRRRPHGRRDPARRHARGRAAARRGAHRPRGGRPAGAAGRGLAGHRRRPPRQRARVQLPRRLQGRDRRCHPHPRARLDARGRQRHPRRRGLRVLQAAGRRAAGDRARRRGRGGDLPLPVPAPDARGAGRGRARARAGVRVRVERRVRRRAATAARASPASPTSSARSAATATARSATRASSTTASTRTSRTTARSASSRASAAASPPRTSCGGSPTSPTSTRCR